MEAEAAAGKAPGVTLAQLHKLLYPGLANVISILIQVAFPAPGSKAAVPSEVQQSGVQPFDVARVMHAAHAYQLARLLVMTHRTSEMHCRPSTRQPQKRRGTFVSTCDTQ